MGTEILAILGVVVAFVTPFLVEVYKRSRANDEQSHISGINAWAEQFVPTSPACPPGYCHLKYVIRNASGNDIRQVAVVQPGRDKLSFVPFIQSGGPDYEEIDPGLRMMDPAFASYPVEIIFVDSKGRTWHKRQVSERIRPLLPHPQLIRDYEPCKNPRGVKVLSQQVPWVVALAVAVMVATNLPIGMIDTGARAIGKVSAVELTPRMGSGLAVAFAC
ncbi:hypothetical protein [Streptomyces sp. G45]|uniref:hypothetical protein n=1 Tax=Streptomyces sp. G45 TaxID=3406627 RepID=UPI003C1792F0